jgi:hypothetical protein
MSNIWQSTLTKDMVEHLDKDTILELIESLNDAVADICEDYGVN